MSNSEERRARRQGAYRLAYSKVTSEDFQENRDLYTKLYQDAFARRECMLCAKPMLSGPKITHRIDDDGNPIGPKLIAHHECLEKFLAGAGWELVGEEAHAVDEQGALLSRSAFEKDPESSPPDISVEQRGDQFFGICRICMIQSVGQADAQTALDALTEHVKGVHQEHHDWRVEITARR